VAAADERPGGPAGGTKVRGRMPDVEMTSAVSTGTAPERATDEPREPGAADRAGGPGRRSELAAGLLRAARPKQWLKNVLVLAAPGAAGVLLSPPVLAEVALAFVALCLVASGTYFLNDAGDVESDRAHPTKRRRPIAAGIVSVRLAVAVGIALMLVGFVVAFAVGWLFLLVVALYVGLSSAYTLSLKHVAVVDIAVIASFFVLRAVAGGVAADVPISRWFLIVASFGSLFVVAGKRYGESLDLGEQRGSVRATLALYSPDYLRFVWTMAAGVTLTAYCLWAFEQAPARAETFPFFELSIVPFGLFVLRYALMVETGRASAPEDVILGDRTLQLLGVAWIAVFGAGVYLGG